MMKAMFGDLPGHEFHGNQWTTGMAAAKEAAGYASEALKASGGDLHSSVAHAATQNAGQLVGPRERATLHGLAVESHATAARALRKVAPEAADLHSNAADAHIRASRAFEKAFKPGKLDGPYRSSGPLKEARDAMLKGKFGRNIVREMKRTAGKAC
jgi:hypothetical protein